MPKAPKIDESRVIEACEAAQHEKKPNLAKIAREYDIPYEILRGRVRRGRQARNAYIPKNKALDEYQEKALVQWITRMRDLYLPVTPEMLTEWANRALVRAGLNYEVSKMWAYRFEKRLPPHLILGPVTQRTKDKKRLDAEDVGYLQHWYSQLANVLKGLPSHLIYNFDECGFQPGQGRARKVIGTKGRCPDLAEFDRAENITAIECIAADGWIMDPLFIFKGEKFMESWYDHPDLPHFWTAVSPKGYINDFLAIGWLHKFHEATKDRVKRGEKRVLIFDGHETHKTVEFLQICEDYNIIPFCFRPHTTHICQPLDGKPFLAYKQHFRKQNNLISQWGGIPAGKADFLKDIVSVRNKTFNQRIIRNSFKERGIYPPNGDPVIQKLQDTLPPISDLLAPDLRAYGETTPPPNISSSSVENTPPKSAQDLEKNQKKLSKIFTTDSLAPKLQRGLQRAFYHHKRTAEELAMMSDTVSRMREIQAPRKRKITRREVPKIGDSGILSTKDANRSLKTRREKEAIQEKKRLDKQWTKLYSQPPPKSPIEERSILSDTVMAAQQGGESFWIDTQGEK
ncbi:transcriptional regulator family: Centromere protein B, DNA-binding region [Penicillium roqueforti]|nr:transcriptional regulator family: Centromere protein B, DNA-binding region [Penicillium roqueforti]KAI3231120.1 transcriptional regulator family: Centromere protein B, DNA-binding region [Penicillium roqueforti]